MTTAPFDQRMIDDAGARVRASRHATSLPLLVLALAVLLVVSARFEPGLTPLVMFISPIGAVVLWIAANLLAKRIGLGTGREHYGVIALFVVLLSVPLRPVNLVLDPAFLLSLSVVVVGWRGRDRTVWAFGLLVAVVGPLLNQSFVRDVIRGAQRALTGEATVTFPIDGLLLGAVGIVLLVVAIGQWNRERRFTRA